MIPLLFKEYPQLGGPILIVIDALNESGGFSKADCTHFSLNIVFSTKIPHTHHIETGDLEFDLLFVGAHVVNPHLQGQRWILRTGSLKRVRSKKKKKETMVLNLAKAAEGFFRWGKLAEIHAYHDHGQRR